MVTISPGMAAADNLIVIEVRCPVPAELPSGLCRPGRLLLKLRMRGQVPSYVHPDNLIELTCDDCKYRLRQAGVRVKRVLHRYDLSGSLVQTLTEGGSDPRSSRYAEGLCSRACRGAVLASGRPARFW